MAMLMAFGALFGALPAAAQVSGEAAAAALFPPDRAAIVLDGEVRLARADRRTLEGVVAAVKYYGAIAFAPDLGLMSPATVVAQNYHSAETAEAVALAECGAKARGAACVIAARVLPEGHAPRALQMSAAATAAFAADYLPAPAPKAFALSAATGSWGFAQGADARARAVADCAAQQAATDCAVAVAD
jgi:hypothetical protein